MAERTPVDSRKGYHYLRAKCPKSAKETTFWISLERMKSIQRHEPKWKILAARSLPEVLNNPTCVSKDLKREGFSDAYCVVGRPSEYHRDITTITPFPAQMLLCVIVAWDAHGWRVLDWEKRREDPNREGFPLNWETDFGEITWPT